VKFLKFLRELAMKRIVGLLLVLGLLQSSEAVLTFREIRTASNNVITVLLRGSTVIANEADTAIASWKINGQPPLAVNVYAMVADNCDHHVFLKTDALVEGKSYTLKTPYGDTTVVFSDKTIFCESIKTNQSAYSGLCKSNFANFSIWLGSGGGKKIEGTLPDYEVFEQFTGKTVANGTLKEIGNSPSSGDFVYRIDLSKVPEGGPYKIAVKGYGCSYPFGVGGSFSRRLAYIIFRGQYHQRCGCPLKAPYTLNIREKPCHTIVYKTNATNSEASLAVTGSEPTFACYGGYHDAGDADRRAFHMANPIINLMIYEAFPDLFSDGQYNIPDKFDSTYNIIGKGNGIPDIIDEAVWGTKVWEYLQNDDGSIQFGTNTTGYPEPFDAPLDKDTKKYGTIKIDDKAASVGAGLFMHLARIIQPYDTVYSNKLASRAEKSFSYINAKMANPEKLYYYIQKYLFDGDESAHTQVKSLKTAVDSYKNNLFACNGYSLNDAKFDNPGYFLSYIVEKKRPIDTAVANYFLTALKNAADTNLARLPKYAYPVGNNPTGTTWGHNVMQPLYACAPLLYWRFSHDQGYFDSACAMMNYQLGLNPLGISFVTGLGFDRIHYPHDRESAYTTNKGWGPKPGITIFGPGVIQVIGSAKTPATFPAMADLPVERKFGDDMNSISTNEYTIFETMTHYALYTVLSSGGTWDEKDDPFAKPQSGIFGKNSVLGARGASADVTIRLADGILKIEFTANAPKRLIGGIYLPNGKRVQGFDAGMQKKGTAFLVPLVSGLARISAGSVLICRIVADDGRGLVEKVVWTR
jgi:endoglucanase